MLQKIQTWLLRKNKKNLYLFIFALAITSLLYLFFGHLAPIISWGILLVICLLFIFIILIIVGAIVLKEIFVLTGAISLLLFVSQSYCNLQEALQTTKSTVALSIILTGAVIFITVSLLIKIAPEIKKTWNELQEDDDFELWEKIFISIVFLIVFIIIGGLLWYGIKPFAQDSCIDFFLVNTITNFPLTEILPNITNLY